MRVRNSAASFTAFALPQPISIPECPLARPLMYRVYHCSFGTVRIFGKTASVFTPPAQPIRSEFPFSWSRLMSVFPFRTAEESASTPVMPASSSTVKRHSSGVSGRLVRAESIRATPAPLSAPRVVPSAQTQPSLMQVEIPQERKSNGAADSGTISMCPCRVMEGKPRRMMIFPAASSMHSRECFAANNFRYSRIFSSCPDGRGIFAISSKYSSADGMQLLCFEELVY